MEVRARAFAEDNSGYGNGPPHPDPYQPMKMTDLKNNRNSSSSFELSDSSSKSKSTFWRRIKHETYEMTRVTVNMLRGNGSKVAYLFIPAFISLFWLGICFMTTRNPNVTLEDQYLKEYFDHHLMEDGTIAIRNTDQEEHEPIHLPEGISINVVIAIPFLDVNPIASTDYIKTLEWILIYSTVPIKFHIITNEDSVKYVDKIMEKINMTSNCDFTHTIMTLSHIIDVTNNEICPKLGTRTEFCEVLMGTMTPLLFPYLFLNLDHVVYVDRSLVFQDNIGLLYPILEKVKRSKAGIAMAPEQTKAYMQAFAAWQKMNPSTKIGRPPPNGKPGFNSDLIVMDLEKLRASASYKGFFNIARLTKLVKTYSYHAESETPSLGDMLNLMAVDIDSLFWTLGCEWNRNSKSTNDVVELKYNVCNADIIHVWNGNPNLDKIRNETNNKGHSRKLVQKTPEELEPQV